MRKKNTPTYLKVLYTLAFPICSFLIMELICRASAGRGLFKTSLDIQNYVRGVGISTCTALALSFNLASGRFDLSLGAQRIMATILGATLAIKLGLGPIGMVLMVFAVGLLGGAIVGTIFVTLRVPPMVLGVGMTMIYECLTFMLTNGEGVMLFGKGYDKLSELSFIIAVVMIAVLLVMFLFKYTKFGYKVRAIAGSQAIAHNSGINIFTHVALCYTLAGGMASFSGLFDAAFKGSMPCSMGMSSNGAVMSNCFPMFLGGYLSRWSSQSVGILVATVTLKFISTGLTVLNVTDTATGVINMTLFLGFLIFRANENIFKIKRSDAQRIQLAKEKRLVRAAA